MPHIAEIMKVAPVIPVLAVENADDAVPLAEALIAGGLRVLEVTLRTPAALEVMRRMATVPGAIVGAGTVLNAKDAERAVEAGASFLISPGLTKPLAKAAAALDVPFLPGVATSSDIMRGLDLGLDHFKLFPAEVVGGVAALKAFAGPFAAVRFCPTGGISPANARNYLALSNVLCVGGSWLAPKEMITNGDWAGITALAREAHAR